MALLPTDFLYAQTGTIPKKTTVSDLLALSPSTIVTDNLNSTSATEALSAAQGRELKNLIDGLGDIIPTPTIASRNLIVGLDAGDVIHVEDDGDGKWARYQIITVTDGSYATSSVVKISDEDALASGLVSTDLSYTASPTQGVIGNTSGSDSAIPAVGAINAGLMIPSDKAKSDLISVTQLVNLDQIEIDAAASKVKSDLISVTQAVDLDAVASVSHLEAAEAAGPNPIVIDANQVFSFDISSLPTV